MAGVKLDFRFQVPAELNETDDQDTSGYHLWRLNLHAEMEGIDLDRDFVVIKLLIMPVGKLPLQRT